MSTGDTSEAVFAREHRGPVFGAFRTGGWEESDAPGVIPRFVIVVPRSSMEDDVEDAAEMRGIAEQATSAADWLEEAQQSA
jgi:hypothetical protein